MDNRYNRREVSVGAAVDYVARAVRASLEQFLGQRGSAEVIPRARNRLESDPGRSARRRRRDGPRALSPAMPAVQPTGTSTSHSTATSCAWPSSARPSSRSTMCSSASA
ncbi:MAG: hypothetical protein MZV65_31645 [Chromatiales bacterium]|nr:hypothetical protein [Chromatiales bacterium]